MDDWLYPLLRFAHYTLLLGLFGITAFRRIGLRESLASQSIRQDNKALAVAALAAPVLTITLTLLGISAMMAQPVWQLEWTTIEAMVLSTSIGWSFLFRLGLLSAAAFILIFFSRSTFGALVAAFLFGLALTTIAWNGHAAATEGTLGTIHRLNDAAHLWAAGLWLGAIGWFVHLTRVASRRPDLIAPIALLSDMHRFAPLGVFLVFAVSVTGLVNAHLIFGLDNSAAVLRTDYGWLFVAKISLVGLMLLLAARNAILGRRHSRIHQTPSDDINSTLSKLRTSLAAEVILALAVLGLVAFIGTMSPLGQ
ncbi:MAG: copper homeostasis membrane protein CopD [Sphingomonadales bacterium]|nr:copper homeostasis membrane protein CopD [Sphingomonadales bacterium]